MIPYEKISLISEKEHSKVWLAGAPELDTVVVVKEITNANTDIIDCIASINNPNIPHILSRQTKDNLTTVVEEYISGLPLNTYVKEKQCSETEIIKLFLQICDAIQILHNQTPPVIHRDLKSSNLLVSSDGIVKIIDFDAAREYKADTNTDTRHLGTASFASPEHYGYSQTDTRSDIYSFGVVMYEAFFGKHFSKNSETDRTDTQDLSLSGSRVQKQLLRIIEKCTMFNPSARYQNISELRHALISCRKHKKLLFAASLTAVLATAVLTGSFLLYQQNNKSTAAAVLPSEAPNLISAEIPVSDAATDAPDKTPAPSDTAKKQKAKKTKRKSAATKAAKTAVSSKSLQTAAPKKKKSTTEKSAVNKENNSESLIPVTVDYSGKSGYYLDIYNSSTGESIAFTYYYLKSNPSLTPINVACGLLDTFHLENVYLEDYSKNTTYVVPTQYWSLKYNHIVSIADSFLSLLKQNNSYRIVLDCSNATISSDLQLISNMSQVAAPYSQYSVSPGCLEYSHKNPTAATLALTNSFGRKITKITLPELGKTVASKYYTIDSNNEFLTFKKSFFKDYSNGSYISLCIYTSKVKQINDAGYASYTFIAKEE